MRGRWNPCTLQVGMENVAAVGNNLAFPQKGETEAPGDAAPPGLRVPPENSSTDVHSRAAHGRNGPGPARPPTRRRVLRSSRERSADTRRQPDGRADTTLRETDPPEGRARCEPAGDGDGDGDGKGQRSWVLGGRGAGGPGKRLPLGAKPLWGPVTMFWKDTPATAVPRSEYTETR